MPISYDVPFEEYIAMPGVHFTALTQMAKSPLHYRRAVDNERKDTAALLMGRLTHALILTPEVADLAVWRGGARRGKEWKAFLSEATAAGKIVATAAEVETSERMRDAVHANPVARELLREGGSEVTVTWAERFTHVPPAGPAHDVAVPCRARLDHWGPAGLVELKTTRHAGQRAWFREAAARYYHVQLAHYVTGLQEAADVNVGAVWWIVVESVPPYDVAVYRVKREHIEAGDRVRMQWLRRVAECEASGRWPGAGGDEPIDYVLPDWAAGEGLEDVDMSGIEGEEVEHG